MFQALFPIPGKGLPIFDETGMIMRKFCPSGNALITAAPSKEPGTKNRFCHKNEIKNGSVDQQRRKT
jgi:hypothetical protein